MSDSAFAPEVRARLPAVVTMRFVANTAMRMTYSFLSPLAAGIGVSRETMGAFISVRDLTSLSSPVIGTWSDRRGYSIVLRVGAVVMTCGLFVSMFGAPGLLAGLVLFGFGRAAYQVASVTWIADQVAYQRRGRATGLVEMVWGGSALLGLPLMGLLIDGVAWWAGFAALGAVAVPLTVVLARQHPQSERRNAVESRRARVDGNARAVLGAYGAMTLASQFLFIGQALWLEDDYGFDPAQVGFAVLTFGAVEVCATFTLAHTSDRMGKRNAMIGGITIMTVGLVALAATGTPPIALGLALVVLTSFGFEFGVVSALPLITELDPGARASMVGYSVGVGTVVRAAGSALAPLLYGAWGFVGLMWLAAGLSAATVVIGIVLVTEPEG